MKKQLVEYQILQPSRWFVLTKCQSFSKLLTHNPYLPQFQRPAWYRHQPQQRLEQQQTGRQTFSLRAVLFGFFTCVGRLLLFLYRQRLFHLKFISLLSNTIRHTFFAPEGLKKRLTFHCDVMLVSFIGMVFLEWNDLISLCFISLGF